MEEYEDELTVVDVYDLASEIGKECKKLIDIFGGDSISMLMPKVISALEQLERFAAKNERENSRIQELQGRISYLENEKLEKAEDRLRYERELEQIEDHWHKESQDLVALVTRLQDENRKLAVSLKEKEGTHKELNPSSEVDIELIQRLKHLADKQREQLLRSERELGSKTLEIENGLAQVERANHVSKELRRKLKLCQMHVRTLIDERADLQGALQDQGEGLINLNKKLGIAQKENEDLNETPDLKNKVVYDIDDPNRPRFTTAELKEILHDRNELKARVSDLEDELELYRPKSEQRYYTRRRSSVTSAAFLAPFRGNSSYTVIAKAVSSENVMSPDSEEEEPAVQGPLPYEPDDAPWKRSESGIRKLFRKLFGEASSSPKRKLLSPLSKVSFSMGTSSSV